MARLVTYSTAADPTRRLGRLADGEVVDLTPANGADLAAAIGRGLVEPSSNAPRLPLDEVIAHAPLARPGKIVCVGLNYHDHCAEQGVDLPAYPMLFAKFANAVTDPGATVVRPASTERLDLECELAAIIGQTVRRATRAEAQAAIFGWTVLNDLTARDLQREDRQWLRAKGTDGFAPMGPWVVTADELADVGGLRLRSSVNGETWQDSSTAEMIWDPATLVAFISRSITLEPGDVVATGTPAGVGHFQQPPRYLADGDEVVCEVEAIGRLTVRITDELPRLADHAAAAGIDDLAGVGA